MAYIDKVYQNTDDMDIPRISYQEATDRLIDDLNKAIGLLPDEWPEYETGRPTVLAAMAVREMAELYASSPLMKNGINTLENNGYDIERAKKTAEYAIDVLRYIDEKMPSKKLYDAGVNGENYQNIFYYNGQNISDEALWYKVTEKTNRNADMYRFMSIHFSNKNNVNET